MRKYIIACLLIIFPIVVSAQVEESFVYDTISTQKSTSTFELPRMAPLNDSIYESVTSPDETIEESKDWRQQNRWRVYGLFGFGINDNEWMFQLSPRVGYRIAKKLEIGMGATYALHSGRGEWDFKQHTIGINGLLYFYPIKYIVLSIEPEAFYSWGTIYGRAFNSKIVPCMPVGLGLLIPVGRTDINISLHYDVIQNSSSPYGDRVFTRIGYSFYW